MSMSSCSFNVAIVPIAINFAMISLDFTLSALASSPTLMVSSTRTTRLCAAGVVIWVFSPFFAELFRFRPRAFRADPW